MKKEFLQLIEAYKEDEDFLDAILENMSRIVRYVDAVTAMEYQIPIIYARYEGEEVRDKIQNLDSRRRTAHEAAIVAVAQLTRWAKVKEVSPMFDGDVTNRYEIADFCMDLVKEFFKEGQKNPNYIIKELCHTVSA